MARMFRPAAIAAAFLVVMVLSLGISGCGPLSGGRAGLSNTVVAQASSTTPASTTPSTTPSTTTPQQPASQPVTASPIPTIQSFVDAVQAGDMDVVSTLTGGKDGALGIVSWNAKDLIGFVGHTTFGKLRCVITHNDGLNANVNLDSFMTFTDPGGFPAVKTVIHLYIDGDFKLKASGNNWTITSLPGYQEPLCDGPTHWGPDPQLFNWPGDAI